MPVIASTPDRLEIQRSKAALARPFLALFLLWLAVLPFLLWHPTAGSLLSAALLLGFFAAVALFTLGDVRIVATAHTLEMYGLFWRQWHVELDRLTIRDGKVGEDIRFEAYVVRDGRHRRGAIVKKDFDAESVQRLIAFLAAHGAVFMARRGGHHEGAGT